MPDQTALLLSPRTPAVVAGLYAWATSPCIHSPLHVCAPSFFPLFPQCAFCSPCAACPTGEVSLSQQPDSWAEPAPAADGSKKKKKKKGGGGGDASEQPSEQVGGTRKRGSVC